jgi:tetratricopeptide (TPR) repeat protein
LIYEKTGDLLNIIDQNVFFRIAVLISVFLAFYNPLPDIVNSDRKNPPDINTPETVYVATGPSSSVNPPETVYVAIYDKKPSHKRTENVTPDEKKSKTLARKQLEKIIDYSHESIQKGSADQVLPRIFAISKIDYLTQEEIVGAYFTIAFSLFSKEKYGAAIELLDSVLSADPSHFLSFKMRGDIQASWGNFSAAVYNYRRSIEINPEYKPAVLQLVYIYTILKRHTEAEDIIENYLKRHPEDQRIKHLKKKYHFGQ